MQKKSKALILMVLLVVLTMLVGLRCSVEEPATLVESMPPVEEPEETTEPEELHDVTADVDIGYNALMVARAEEVATCMDQIIRVVVAEAGNQGYDGMRSVAQVIYDRRYNSTYDFGDTLEEVISAEGQFCKPYAGDIEPWMPTVAEACWAVFYADDFVFDEPVHYFYRDDMISQDSRDWFENKKYVGVLGAHTFRSEG